MKKIRIVFNSRGNYNIGSVRIPHYAIKAEFEKFKEFEVFSNDFDNYDKYDVAILHGDDEEVLKAREQNNRIVIGLAKPHHERVVHPPFKKMSLKSLLYQVRFFTNDEKSVFMKERNRKLEVADFLIADTVHLQHYFEANGSNAVYIKLLEAYDSSLISNFDSNKSDNSITFGYHGNPRHFIESASYIFPALNHLSNYYDVKLIVVSNTSEINLKSFGELKFGIELHEYSYPDIFNVLSVVDIGLVPNQISFAGKLSRKLLTKYGALFWDTDRAHDLVFRYKQSVNGGRAFVFAQLGIPFVACPVPELLSIFGSDLEDCFPYDQFTWNHVIVKLANNPIRRKEIKNSLLKRVSEDLNVEYEATKLKRYILDGFSF